VDLQTLSPEIKIIVFVITASN